MYESKVGSHSVSQHSVVAGIARQTELLVPTEEVDPLTTNQKRARLSGTDLLGSCTYRISSSSNFKRKTRSLQRERERGEREGDRERRNREGYRERRDREGDREKERGGDREWRDREGDRERRDRERRREGEIESGERGRDRERRERERERGRGRIVKVLLLLSELSDEKVMKVDTWVLIIYKFHISWQIHILWFTTIFILVARRHILQRERSQSGFLL